MVSLLSVKSGHGAGFTERTLTLSKSPHIKTISFLIRLSFLPSDTASEVYFDLPVKKFSDCVAIFIRRQLSDYTAAPRAPSPARSLYRSENYSLTLTGLGGAAPFGHPINLRMKLSRYCSSRLQSENKDKKKTEVLRKTKMRTKINLHAFTFHQNIGSKMFVIKL
jgi:hypothetical protein